MCVWVGVSAWEWRCARMCLASGEEPSSWLCGWNANTASEINHCLQPWLCDSGWLRATCQASWARALTAHSWLSISPQGDLWAPGRSVQVWGAPSDGPQPWVGSLDASVPSWALQRASWPKCTHLLQICVYMGNPRGMGYTFSFYCWDASGKDWIRDRGWERQRSTFVAQPCCMFNQTYCVFIDFPCLPMKLMHFIPSFFPPSPSSFLSSLLPPFLLQIVSWSYLMHLGWCQWLGLEQGRVRPQPEPLDLSGDTHGASHHPRGMSMWENMS